MMKNVLEIQIYLPLHYNYKREILKTLINLTQIIIYALKLLKALNTHVYLTDLILKHSTHVI